MASESTPAKFTAPAARIWKAISPNEQQSLVSRSWCSKCQQEVKITGYSGSIKVGHVLLSGTCSSCGGKAYRFIETKLNEDKSLTIVLGKTKLIWTDAYAVAKLAQKEAKLLQKRQRQLDKKLDEGTITKAEERELKLISKNGMNEAIMKMYTTSMQMSDSIEI